MTEDECQKRFSAFSSLAIQTVMERAARRAPRAEVGQDGVPDGYVRITGRGPDMMSVPSAEDERRTTEFYADLARRGLVRVPGYPPRPQVNN